MMHQSFDAPLLPPSRSMHPVVAKLPDWDDAWSDEAKLSWLDAFERMVSALSGWRPSVCGHVNGGDVCEREFGHDGLHAARENRCGFIDDVTHW